MMDLAFSLFNLKLWTQCLFMLVVSCFYSLLCFEVFMKPIVTFKSLELIFHPFLHCLNSGLDFSSLFILEYYFLAEKV